MWTAASLPLLPIEPPGYSISLGPSVSRCVAHKQKSWLRSCRRALSVCYRHAAEQPNFVDDTTCNVGLLGECFPHKRRTDDVKLCSTGKLHYQNTTFIFITYDIYTSKHTFSDHSVKYCVQMCIMLFECRFSVAHALLSVNSEREK